MTAQRTILLVEDNRQDEKLTLRALHKLQLGCDIDVVRDGAEAIDYLWRQGAHAHRTAEPMPIVVLLDLKLPKKSGIEVLTDLRTHEATRTLPVVVLTSSDEERDVFDSYHSGANAYVQKPVNSEAFVEAVKRLGVFWLTVNSTAES